MPEISVIVPVYKTEKYLNQCVQSILAQTLENLELILVNDGSPDNCGKLCNQYAEQDHRIKVIHQNNQGLSAARNAGIKMARGRYIGFVDSDDWIHPEMYQVLHQDIVQLNADIAACGIKKIWGTEGHTPLHHTTVPVAGSGKAALENILRCTAKGGHTAWNRLYHRDLFDTIMFPAGKLYEDAFTIPLLYHKSRKVSWREDLLYYYRQRSESIMSRPFDGRSMDKLCAAETLLEFVKQYEPDMVKSALCFQTVSALRLMADLLAVDKERFPKEYQAVRGHIRIKDAFTGSALSVRHRVLIVLFYVSPGAYRKIWAAKVDN